MNAKLKRHQVLWFLSSIAIISFVINFVGLSDSSLFNAFSILVMFFSLLGLGLQSDKAFTLSKMIYIFIFFFFGVIPLNDYVRSNVYYGGVGVDNSIQLLTIIIIFSATLMFFSLNSIFDIIFKNRFKINQKKNHIVSEMMSVTDFSFIKASVFFSVITYLVISAADFDLINLAFRGVINELTNEANSKSFSMLTDYVLKPMPLIFIIYFHWKLRYVKLKVSQKLSFLMFFLVSIFLVLPTSVPRFLAAALYIPIFFQLTTVWKKPYFMIVAMISSLLVVFPLLNNFRRFDREKPLFSIDFDFLNHGHFDAFQNFSRVVENDTVTYGSQLLGSFFFFIPRIFWESKPVGSGSLIAAEDNLVYANISMPFFAEGFINFGIAGVYLFTSLLAITVSYFDNKYWSPSGQNKKSIVFYYLSFGLIFFMMRGDLLSSTAFFFGVYLSFFIVRCVLDFSIKYKVMK